MSKRDFKVRYENELKVTLDMDKYNKETLKSLRAIWGYKEEDFTDEEVIEECVSDIVHDFMRNGYLDKEIEDFPIGGQECMKTNVRMEVEEIIE